MATATLSNTDRLRELGTAPIGKILLKYSLPAVVGTVVSAIYNIIDSIVIGHAIDDPNVVSGIAVTFPVMTLVTALGMLIGAGAATRVSIVLGQNDKKMAETILGNCVQLTLIIGIAYVGAFSIFIDPILKMFGASPNTLPYAREFMLWVLPGCVLQNLTFSYNNVMRASGYPGKAMYTNMIGAGVNHDCGNRIVTAVTVERVVDYGVYSRTGYIYKERSHADIKDAFDNPPLQTESSFDEMQSIFFVEEMAHYEECRYKHRNVGGDGGTAYSPVETEEKQRGENSVDSSSDHVLINNTLYSYGGDNAIAAVVVFNRFVTIFVFVIIGICQGMQPIVGYNYGSGRHSRLFHTLWLAAGSAVVISTIGSIVGAVFPRQIASMFMQDEAQITCAVNCLHYTTIMFWMVGFQIVATNFFQALGMAGKAIFLSLTRQIIFMIPMLLILPPHMGLNGVWAAFPVSDTAATIVTASLLFFQIRKIKAAKNAYGVSALPTHCVFRRFLMRSFADLIPIMMPSVQEQYFLILRKLWIYRRVCSTAGRL